MLQKSLLGQAHKTTDKWRSKLSGKIGLMAPRDFGAEWIHGKGASQSNYAKAPKTTTQRAASMFQVTRGTGRESRQ